MKKKRKNTDFNAKIKAVLTGKPLKEVKLVGKSIPQLKKLLWNEISKYVRREPFCKICQQPTQCACHIVPSNDGAMTKFFLPNIYPGCFSCNNKERRFRFSWVFIHKQLFGEDYVNALYMMSRDIFQFKRPWIIEQIHRFKALNSTYNQHI